jgi:hypothetical protein
MEDNGTNGYFVIHYELEMPVQVDYCIELLNDKEHYEVNFSSELYCLWKERDPYTGEEKDSDFDPDMPDRVHDKMNEYTWNRGYSYTINIKTLEVKKNEKS